MTAIRTCGNCGVEGPIPAEVEYYWTTDPTREQGLKLILLCRGCNKLAWDVKRRGLPPKKRETQKNKFEKVRWG